jgi:hypothetical protein
MPLIDAATQFSSAQAFTTGANNSTNVIDTLPMTSNPNSTSNLGGEGATFLRVFVDTTATSGGSSTVTVALVSSASTALTSVTTHYTSAAIAVASLVAGFTAVDIQLPPGQYKRYLGIIYTVATADLTAGKFTAALSKDRQDFVAYATGSAPNL